MRNSSCNVLGIPHFIRSTDAHIAVAIYFLLTQTTLRLTHIRCQDITFLFFSSMATLQNDIEEIAYDLFVNLPLSPRPADLNWDQIRA